MGTVLSNLGVKNEKMASAKNPITRIFLFSSALAMLVGSTPSFGQETDESRMSLTLFGGVVQSTTDLWDIPAQRVGILTQGGVETSVDTFALARGARSGLALGIAGAYFPSPMLGYAFELSLFDPGLSTDCRISFDSRPANAFNPNRGYCADINQRKVSMGTVNITVSGLFRPFPRALTQPYLRLVAGASDVGGGSTEVVGRFGTIDRPLILDRGAGFQPTAGIGLGMVIPVSPGYGVRMELRDQLYRVRALDGAADALAIAPSSHRWTHNVAFLVGVDIVLQKKRGRRY